MLPAELLSSIGRVSRQHNPKSRIWLILMTLDALDRRGVRLHGWLPSLAIQSCVTRFSVPLAVCTYLPRASRKLGKSLGITALGLLWLRPTPQSRAVFKRRSKRPEDWTEQVVKFRQCPPQRSPRLLIHPPIARGSTSG